MGDIRTHAEINIDVIRLLQAISINEDWLYLEYGNMLTDISQFRDPFAQIGAKQKIWNRALFNKGVIPILGPILIKLGVGNVKSWMDELLGKAEEGKRYGKLAQYFHHFNRFIAHQLFSQDSPISFKEIYKEMLLGVEFSKIKLLSAEEVNRVFDKYFTQYYPHEHMDLPPYLEAVKQRQHKLYQRTRRGLIGYLEEQIQYLSEGLTKLEYNWMQRRHLHPSHEERRDLLVQLGHLLHAVEDYYFHSNFVEVWEWLKTCSYSPLYSPKKNEEYKQFLLEKCFLNTYVAQGKLSTDKKTLYMRKLNRRLCFPVVTEDGGDKKVSINATDMVYTGGFAEKDMFHTIYGVLHRLEVMLKKHPLVEKLRNSDLVLLKLLLNEEERRKMVENKTTEQMLEMHKEQLQQGRYKNLAYQLHTLKLITDEGVKALLDAFAIDEQFELSYTLAPGVGGFIILLLAEMQMETDYNHQKITKLNEIPNSIYYQGTTNGISDEEIGSHSLMAKDTLEEEPMRAEANTLAKFASSTIAQLLLQRVTQDSNPNWGIDWDKILQYFLRFPNIHSKSWESEVLAALKNGDAIPCYNQLKNPPKINKLQSDDKKLKQRREGEIKYVLEKRYQQLERKLDF
ncbi:hypothetical protein OCA23_27145 [Bacillus cereus]|nr:hypothetical protein [Bacillus cereus]